MVQVDNIPYLMGHTIGIKQQSLTQLQKEL